MHVVLCHLPDYVNLRKKALIHRDWGEVEYLLLFSDLQWRPAQGWFSLFHHLWHFNKRFLWRACSSVPIKQFYFSNWESFHFKTSPVYQYTSTCNLLYQGSLQLPRDSLSVIPKHRVRRFSPLISLQQETIEENSQNIFFSCSWGTLKC